MKTYEITIEGVTPLLMHAFTDAAQIAATEGTRNSAVGGTEEPREQAESCLYTDNDGNPIIPQPNLLRCIMDAGKFFKNGRSKVTTQKSSLIPACVDIAELAIPLVSENGWKVDTRPVRIPATGGRILRHRPCFDDWRLTFTLELDTEIISPKLLREIVDAAGKRIGLGDFRPDTKGPFGKFKVVHWEEQKPNLKAA